MFARIVSYLFPHLVREVPIPGPAVTRWVYTGNLPVSVDAASIRIRLADTAPKNAIALTGRHYVVEAIDKDGVATALPRVQEVSFTVGVDSLAQVSLEYIDHAPSSVV